MSENEQDVLFPLKAGDVVLLRSGDRTVVEVVEKDVALLRNGTYVSASSGRSGDLLPTLDDVVKRAPPHVIKPPTPWWRSFEFFMVCMFTLITLGFFTSIIIISNR